MRKATGFLINAGPTLIILSLLRERPQPAFDIAQELKHRSLGKLIFQQSTLYPILNKLAKEGLIKSSWELPDNDSARRIYHLTEKGRTEADRQVDSWNDYVATIGRVLEGPQP